MKRRGVLLATAILPDGTRAMIPAAWTDFAVSANAQPPRALVASIDQLLLARTVIAPLLRRLESVHPAPSPNAAEVRTDAAAPELRRAKRTRERTEHLANVADRATPKSDRSARASTGKGRSKRPTRRSTKPRGAK